ncbi:hypothetical protein MLP_09530 [Microlunatus phosphovorus NM-1]|uniref:Uncharacterized protein n=1 Tax=Microlunatus phosphovorus (strain ATCC 700054 / DSM 10555 / JCM 9379 / NBRC 101784 / NCIMB 13414 / VKM Ac-1990 / NM-1) TaxID=1032480 RepID=F5XMP4_MICPN|nr:hypothetical protein MLP_09530 [Microlunatus phosphovorus NM-1]
MIAIEKAPHPRSADPRVLGRIWCDLAPNPCHESAIQRNARHREGDYYSSRHLATIRTANGLRTRRLAAC